jgi:hypothetical protein
MLNLSWYLGDVCSYLLVPTMRHGNYGGRKNGTNHVKMHLVFHVFGCRDSVLWIVGDVR